MYLIQAYASVNVSDSKGKTRKTVPEATLRLEAKGIDPSAGWHVYYFDPVTGRKVEQGIIKASVKAGGKIAKPVEFNRTVPSPQNWVLVLEKIAE